MDPEKGTETKPAGNPLVTETVTNEMLDAALESTETEPAETEGTTKETAEELKKEEELPEEPTDNAERSRLGRRMRRVEDTLSEIRDLLSQRPAETTRNADETGTPENEEMPEYVSTPQDVVKVMTLVEKQKSAQDQKYQDLYRGNLAKLGQANEDLHDEIVAELIKNYNVRYTGNPLVDSELSYAKAQAAVFSRKVSGKTVPFKGENPPAKPALPDKAENTAPIPIRLDPLAAEFAKWAGYKEEDIAAEFGKK